MARGELTPLDENIKKIVSTNLFEISNNKNMRQADIVRASGLAKSTISGYFKGISLPTKTNLIKLAKALNVSPSDIDPRYSSKKTNVNYKLDDSAPQNVAEKNMLVAFRKQTEGMSEEDQIKFQRSLNKLMDAAKGLNDLGD